MRINASDLSLDDWGALFGVDIYTEPRGMLIADAVNCDPTEGKRARWSCNEALHKRTSISHCGSAQVHPAPTPLTVPR